MSAEAADTTNSVEPGTTTGRRWMIRSGSLAAVIEAPDQWAAWDTWRGEDRYQFGLIATAEPDEDGNPIPVHTAALMERWGRVHDAEQFHELARSAGLT